MVVIDIFIQIKWYLRKQVVFIKKYLKISLIEVVIDGNENLVLYENFKVYIIIRK